ncbi:MAG: hypothetical protein MUC49_12480 [Raineya sp.]|jgi:hypothetical protein|nr:hypothetical protein [Raineya sp.]
MIKLLSKWFFNTWIKRKFLNKWFITNNFGLVECIQVQGEYLTVKNKKGTFQVRKESISKILPTPKFKIGDMVYELNKPNIKVIVSDMFWHFKRKKYVYYVDINGKRKSKWLYDKDLIVFYD